MSTQRCPSLLPLGAGGLDAARRAQWPSPAPCPQAAVHKGARLPLPSRRAATRTCWAARWAPRRGPRATSRAARGRAGPGAQRPAPGRPPLRTRVVAAAAAGAAAAEGRGAGEGRCTARHRAHLLSRGLSWGAARGELPGALCAVRPRARGAPDAAAAAPRRDVVSHEAMVAAATRRDEPLTIGGEGRCALLVVWRLPRGVLVLGPAR